MTDKENERLAVVETQVKGLRGDVAEIKENVKGIDGKLDIAIACKADKTEVTELRALMWKMAGAAILTLLGLGAFIIQQLIARGLAG